MKYISLFVLAFIPFLASASVADTLVAFEDSSKVFESISLWATIVIAFATSVMVWMGGRQMHGGIFGKVLTYFSIGMTLIFLGYVAGAPFAENWLPSLYLKLAHDSLFIIGYISMGIAASKLLGAIKGE